MGAPRAAGGWVTANTSSASDPARMRCVDVNSLPPRRPLVSLLAGLGPSFRGTIASQVRELAARTKCSTVSGRRSTIAHEGTYFTAETEPLSQLSELWANLEEQKVERQILPRGASLISRNC